MTIKKPLVVKQPKIKGLIWELNLLTELTQGELADSVGELRR